MNKILTAVVALAGMSLPAAASVPKQDNMYSQLRRTLLSDAERKSMFDCMTRQIPGITLFELKSLAQVRRFFSVTDAPLYRFESSKSVFYQFYTAPAGSTEATEAVPLRLGTAEPDVGFSNLQTGQTFAFPERVAVRFRACDKTFKPSR